jgi:hypothetical protein
MRVSHHGWMSSFFSSVYGEFVEGYGCLSLTRHSATVAGRETGIP